MKQENSPTHKDLEQQSKHTVPFEFLAGNLALDFVNTEVPVRGGKTRDLLLTTVAAAQWWHEAQERYSEMTENVNVSRWDADVLEAMKMLRAVLRHLFRVIATQQHLREGDLTDLNQILKKVYPVVEITPEGRPVAEYRSREEGTSMLLVIALAALHLITQQELVRLHACHNPTCTLFFYDATKSATRHWCSVSCKERARSIVRYKKRASAQEGVPS